MKTGGLCLAINGGSSSIKFAVFEAATEPRLILSGKIDRASQSAQIEAHRPGDAKPQITPMKAGAKIEDELIRWLQAQPESVSIAVVVHRIVHGMSVMDPQRATDKVLAHLRALQDFDPEHLPRELELIDAFGAAWPAREIVLCFDTAFHRHMPLCARQLALPRKYYDQGILRYGFHGLSYQFLCEELARRHEPAITKGRVVLAHLGSGASVAAVRGGIGIDTSMSFTPSSGFPMSTRSGDLDPGVSAYLLREQGLSADDFLHLVNRQSGLLGISEISGDMRDLLATENTDSRAAEAITLFCYQCAKSIGSMAAALSGLDALVFAGGIGESAASIRARICAQLEYLGIELDAALNERAEAIATSPASRVRVHIIKTNEELMMARLAQRVSRMG